MAKIFGNEKLKAFTMSMEVQNLAMTQMFESFVKGGNKQSVPQQNAAIPNEVQAYPPDITKDLWAYLKKNNLQDQENKSFFTPDKKMTKTFVRRGNKQSVPQQYAAILKEVVSPVKCNFSRFYCYVL